MNLLNNAKKQERKSIFSATAVNIAAFFFGGLITGAVIKLLDIYTTNIGNIFSGISVWIFICTLIAVYSSTAKRAAGNVFCFCSAMLLAYYITAELTAGIYSLKFAYGWLIFDLFCPIMGACVWQIKAKRPVSAVIYAGVILTIPAASVIMYDRLRIWDVLFMILTSAVLSNVRSDKEKRK